MLINDIITVTGEDAYTVNYSYDLNNRLRKEVKAYGETKEETKYGYDPNGNMISKLNSNNGYKLTPTVSLSTSDKDWTLYEYNGFNQLVIANENGVKASYTYDHNGLRQSKTVNGVTTSHIWDGTNMVAETQGINETLYIRGMGIVSSKTGEDVTYYLYNGHGDVNMLMDANGNITKQYTYDAFGVERNKDENDTNPFRYCGEYYDAETDSIYLRARYYTPSTGRFTTEDPIQDGLNWYNYCSGNPIAFVDPSGLLESSSILKIGTYNNEDVKQVQQKLNTLGYVGADGKPLTVDGDFGTNTDYAVREYQSDNGLDVDGIVGKNTWTSLGFILTEGLPSTNEPNSTSKLYNPDGSVKQERTYGPDGKAQLDIDYNHGGEGHEFPHIHEWDWSQKKPRQGSKPMPNKDSMQTQTSTWQRALLLTGGALIIIGTVAEDFMSGGAGISNDAQTIQQGVTQIQQAFK